MGVWEQKKFNCRERQFLKQSNTINLHEVHSNCNSGLQRNTIPKAKQYNQSGHEVNSNRNSGLKRNTIPKAKQ
jgi:hypothetical protein